MVSDEKRSKINSSDHFSNLPTEISSSNRSRSSSLDPLDFSSDGIRTIVESTVSSSSARQQLLNYISQLQIAAYGQSSSSIDHDNETNLLRVRIIDLFQVFFSLIYIA